MPELGEWRNATERTFAELGFGLDLERIARLERGSREKMPPRRIPAATANGELGCNVAPRRVQSSVQIANGLNARVFVW